MDEQDYICCPIERFSTLLNYEIPLWACNVEPLVPRSDYAYRNSGREIYTKYNPDEIGIEPKPVKCFELPKTLVCHDMKGGYLEDKYANGSNKGYQYVFQNWSNIDIFVYFSHKFITIPPLGWINAAHSNGVKIFGTIITEGKEGHQMCSSIFKDEITVVTFCSKLVEVSRHLKIDGWLLNFENKINNVSNLLKFVQLFTESMHDMMPHSQVIWYDSILVTGDLRYQNELNSLNKCFFDACDGIFLNYNWDKTTLENSYKLAGNRHFDVYVGIDVFGRNGPQCGGFNSRTALDVIQKHRLSYAIFAPGWTYECNPDIDKRNSFNSFLCRNTQFWNSLWPYLNTYPVTKKSFATNFYLGTCETSYNLNDQQLQLSVPIRNKDNHEDPTTTCLERENNGKNIVLRKFNPWTNMISRSYNPMFSHILFDLDIEMISDFLLIVLLASDNDNTNTTLNYKIQLIVTDKEFTDFKPIILDENVDCSGKDVEAAKCRLLDQGFKLNSDNRIRCFRIKSSRDFTRLVRLNMISNEYPTEIHIDFIALMPISDKIID